MNLDLRLADRPDVLDLRRLLTGYGLVSDNAIYARSLGINVNLWWGLVLLGFGLVMLGLVARSRRAPRAE